jgi:hypothetical protein
MQETILLFNSLDVFMLTLNQVLILQLDTPGRISLIRIEYLHIHSSQYILGADII